MGKADEYAQAVKDHEWATRKLQRETPKRPTFFLLMKAIGLVRDDGRIEIESPGYSISSDQAREFGKWLLEMAGPSEEDLHQPVL